MLNVTDCCLCCQTERLEGKDHDSSINSKINLVDLAGSERQSQAQTSGERLRVSENHIYAYLKTTFTRKWKPCLRVSENHVYA